MGHIPFRTIARTGGRDPLCNANWCNLPDQRTDWLPGQSANGMGWQLPERCHKQRAGCHTCSLRGQCDMVGRCLLLGLDEDHQIPASHRQHLADRQFGANTAIFWIGTEYLPTQSGDLREHPITHKCRDIHNRGLASTDRHVRLQARRSGTLRNTNLLLDGIQQVGVDLLLG